MWQYHLNKLIFSLLLLLAGITLALQYGSFKPFVRLDLWDSVGELTSLAVAIGWLCLIVSSRPAGPVTNWLYSGSFLLVFSYTVDLLDEVIAYPEPHRLMSWLESFPAPVGMLLLTFGLVGWHREQLAINRQLQGRELFLRNHALIDPLTQLYGPAYLQAVLQRELELHRQQQQPLSLLMLDIRGFSAYNRHFGIAAGDHFLTQFSELLTHQLRPRDLICRLAGDCFVAVLPQTEAASASVLQNHLQQQLRQLLPEQNVQLTSVALELPLAQINHADVALSMARQALQQAKPITPPLATALS
jgi:diguanylate cyclase (GGDEF)-like protein